MATPPTPVGASTPDPTVADHRKRLEALRDVLTAAIADAGPRDLAPLAGQLRRVLADLAALPQTEGVSLADDLAAKRARRRSAASA